jgi:hypothetical protein
MKKIILLAAIVFLTAPLGYSQRLKITDDELDKKVLAVALDGPAMATTEMKEELQLDAQQVKEVAHLNQERYQQLMRADALYADNPLTRAKQVRTIHQQNDKALSSVLSEQQLHHFLELEGRQNSGFVSENDDK